MLHKKSTFCTFKCDGAQVQRRCRRRRRRGPTWWSSLVVFVKVSLLFFFCSLFSVSSSLLFIYSTQHIAHQKVVKKGVSGLIKKSLRSQLFFFFFFFFTFFSSPSNPSSSTRERERETHMASSGGDAGGSDGDKAPEKAEEKKKRDKTKDVATAILERKKAPNRLVVGACESGSRRNHHSSSSIAQKSLLLLLNRRRKTFLSRRVMVARARARPLKNRRSTTSLLCVSLWEEDVLDRRDHRPRTARWRWWLLVWRRLDTTTTTPQRAPLFDLFFFVSSKNRAVLFII